MEAVTEMKPSTHESELEALTRRYNEVCYHIGNETYKKHLSDQEIHKLTSQLKDINEKGFKLKQKIEAAAKTEPMTPETPAHVEEQPNGQA